MRIVYSNYLPVGKKFLAINLFEIVVARHELSEDEENHEYIHSLQQREMLYVFFYLWYVVEWLIKLVYYRDFIKAYRNISFEREAYANQYDTCYRHHRKHYAWFKKISDISHLSTNFCIL